MNRQAYPGDVSDDEWAFVALNLHVDEGTEATALLDNSLTLARQIGNNPWLDPAQRADRDARLADARQDLGDAAADEAWARGSAMTFDEAVAFALRAT